MNRRTRSTVRTLGTVAAGLSIVVAAGACSDDDPIFAPTSTTAAAAAYGATAAATVEIAGPTFTGVRQFTQDAGAPTVARPAESTLDMRLTSTDAEGQSVNLGVGGAVPVGQWASTGSTLTVSYIGDGVILTATKGECRVRLDRFDAKGAAGNVECLDVDVGGSPFTLRATFEVTSTGAPPPTTTTTPDDTPDAAPAPAPAPDGVTSTGPGSSVP